MYQLDMNSITKTASGSAVAWETVTDPSFQAGDYRTTMAQASNHISASNGLPGVQN
jgi:hypothetical protein